MSEKFYEGRIIQTAPSGGSEGDQVSIAITDVASGCEIVEITMSEEQFGRMLSRPAEAKCKFAVRPKNLGMKHEQKTVLVPLIKFDRRDNATAAKQLQPFEKDGWKGDVSDYCNHHRWSIDKDGKEFQAVIFRRYVPANEP